jgi:hypothetical protein
MLICLAITRENKGKQPADDRLLRQRSANVAFSAQIEPLFDRRFRRKKKSRRLKMS